MRKYFYIKFYMCSPVVHKHATGPTVVPLGSACRCRHRPVSHYMYLFDSLLMTTVIATAFPTAYLQHR